MESILIPLAPFVMIVLIIWISSNEKRKRYQVQAELYAKALEKGQPIPNDLFAEPKKKSNPLNTGIICISAGIGLWLFFWMVSSFTAQLDKTASAVFISFAAVSIIPILIGVAFVIIHFIEKKKATAENAQ